MPGKNECGASTKHTTHLAMPKTSAGKIDKRFTTPQFVKSDGTRDKRTTSTMKRK